MAAVVAVWNFIRGELGGEPAALLVGEPVGLAPKPTDTCGGILIGAPKPPGL